jgi:hypothetical protein
MVGIRRILARGWRDAAASFGGVPAVIGVCAIPILAATFYWQLGDIPGLNTVYSSLIYALAAAGGVFVCLLGWNLCAAPYRLQKDRADSENLRAEQAEVKLKSAAEQASLPHSFVKSLSDVQSTVGNLEKKLMMMAALTEQFRRLLKATFQTAKFRGQNLELDDIGIVAKFLADEAQSILPAVPFRPDEELIFQTGWNQYRYIFTVPMSRPPRIEFSGLNKEVEATVLRVSKIDFEVSFFHIPSQNREIVPPQPFIADAELSGSD